MRTKQEFNSFEKIWQIWATAIVKKICTWSSKIKETSEIIINLFNTKRFLH